MIGFGRLVIFPFALLGAALAFALYPFYVTVRCTFVWLQKLWEEV